MSRSISEIKNQMLVEKANQPALAPLNSPSQTAFWNLMLYLCAFAINIFEQLQDIFAAQQKQISLSSIPGTAQWVQKKTFEFQYDATNIQYLQLNTSTLVVSYPNIIPLYQIITRCAVHSVGQGQTTIKVAKGSTPVKLTSSELSSLQNYWNPNISNAFGFAGVSYLVISNDADEIEIVGQIYYNGQYSATIQSDVSNAINTYLANLDFDGYISLNKIEDAIQAVVGVNNVRISFVRIRRNTQTYGEGIVLYDLSANINGVKTGTFAGYAVTETTSGHTITDTLTFISQ